MGIGLAQLFQAPSVAGRLAPWANWFTPDGFIEVWPRAPWVHLGYVLLLAGVVAGAALLRDRHTVPIIALTLSCALGTALVSWQLLSVWNDADTLAAFERTERDPTTLHSCTNEGVIKVCAPPAYLPWAPQLAAPAQAASQLLRASDRPDQIRIELADTWPATLMVSLPDDVRQRLVGQRLQRRLPENTILLPSNLRSDRPDSGP